VPQPSDTAWFLEQVQREQSRLRSSIRALGVRAEAVDDIAQEALVIALTKLEDFGRGSDFGAWVRQIARRLVANERRKEIRRNLILSDHVTDLLIELVSEPANPGKRQEHEEELVALRVCLAELPKNSRELLHQRYFEDLRPGAIASRLGVASNQVRQMLLRLRRELLECIERRLGIETG
jgi:RNA polymerase sigma-70 factor (ECF subfamily)